MPPPPGLVRAPLRHVRPACRCRPNRPDPHQDRPATGTDIPNRTGRLLTLVRTLIDYGRHLAAALQQRTSATDLADITRHFGIVDIGEILARITRGLLRAAALEARLISHPIREPAAPATRPSRPLASRAPPNAARSQYLGMVRRYQPAPPRQRPLGG